MQENNAPSTWADARRIELRHDFDAAYWCRVFDISRAELRTAVQHAGPQVDAVCRYLAAHGQGRALPH